MMVPAFNILAKGITLGLMVSVPLGPVGILLINRTIKRGMLSGFFSGLALAIADTILAFIAGLGFTIILSFIREERFIITLIAGLLIIAIGIKVLFTNLIKDFRKNEKVNKTLWRDFVSVFILSITNPFTIFVFLAFFSGINISNNISPYLFTLLLISGVFIGALGWWWFLSFCVSRFKEKIRLRTIIIINRVAGVLIIAIGLIMLISLFITQNTNPV